MLIFLLIKFGIRLIAFNDAASNTGRSNRNELICWVFS